VERRGDVLEVFHVFLKSKKVGPRFARSQNVVLTKRASQIFVYNEA